MTEEQIKHMVDRFLNWKLPENFRPDAGISFKRWFNENTTHPMKHEPRGTNLFDASQAEAMVRHMLEGVSDDRRTVTLAFRDDEMDHLECFCEGMGMSVSLAAKVALRFYASHFERPSRLSLQEPSDVVRAAPRQPAGVLLVTVDGDRLRDQHGNVVGTIVSSTLGATEG
jgi:hypothetical protein